jgi:hypothetical protein
MLERKSGGVAGANRDGDRTTEQSAGKRTLVELLEPDLESPSAAISDGAAPLSREICMIRHGMSLTSL